jgi:putative membrane protein
VSARPTNPPPRPRIEAEALPAPRLDAPLDLTESAVPARKAGWSTPALITGGLGLLLLGFAGLDASNFVADEFTRGQALGWAALGFTGVGFTLIGAGVLRETASLAALRAVDRLRADLASPDPHRRVRAARAYVKHLPEAPTLLPAIAAINDPDAILALLRAGPAAALRAQSEVLGRAAALQAVAGIAAMPSAGLAAIFIAWRGLRLVRQVAALHGFRPGLIASLALIRRTALSAGAVAGSEIAVNAAAHALVSNPLLQHLAGDMAGAGVAARRMVVLARAADAACSPVPAE